MTKALLYCRVSTDEQVNVGASMDAQEQALMVEAVKRGYEFEVVREEGKSAKSIVGRDKLVEALDLLDTHKADVLMAVRMDRLTRDVSDVNAIVKRSKKRGWGLIIQGEKIDTTPDGEFRMNLDAALAQRERGMVGVRTREGMAQRKAEGWPNGSAGRKVAPEFVDTYRDVLRMVKRGYSYNSIAKSLNDKGTRTARGARWYASTVKAIVESETAKTISK
jgi:DNA invertase Pin-like site-specific DNA recombinase